MAPAKIFGIAKALFIIGADIEDDGQSARGMDSPDECIERKLADGNAQAADALIADAENAFAVGDDDDVYFGIWRCCAGAQGSNPAADRR